MARLFLGQLVYNWQTKVNTGKISYHWYANSTNVGIHCIYFQCVPEQMDIGIKLLSSVYDGIVIP